MINENGIQQRVYVIATQRHIHANVGGHSKTTNTITDEIN